jgi:metallo-beta-lactamase class B
MMRLIQGAVVALALSTALFAFQGAPKEWTERTAPYLILDGIYYVGTVDLGSYLITSPAGHILIDTGVEQNAASISDSIRALGFNVKDIRIILTTQAHFDHVGALAKLKERTGARVLASAADAPLLEQGGKGDYLFGPEFYFRPVHVDAIVKDGEVVRLGGRALVAHLTPGHTQGTTTWTLDAQDKLRRVRHVMFMGSTTVNDGAKLVDNEKYPAIATDYRRSFMVLKALPCDVFLTAHASVFRGADKAAAAAAGKGEDAFVDPRGCRDVIERMRKAFDEKLAAQRAGHGQG